MIFISINSNTIQSPLINKILWLYNIRIYMEFKLHIHYSYIAVAYNVYTSDK